MVMKHHKTFAQKHEQDLIFLLVGIIGILMGIAPWLAI